MTPPVLVTRDAESTALVVARLRARGVPAVAAPCLAFRPEPGLRAALAPYRGAGADIAITSPRAVEALAGLPVDPAWRVLALAPRTAAAVRAMGWPVHVEVEGGGADIAARARPGPLLLPTSDRGGDEALRVRPDAVRLVAYRTDCPADLPAEARAAMAAPYDVLAASPSALEHLDRLAPGAVAGARVVWCHGRTTLDAARRLGAARATSADLADWS